MTENQINSSTSIVFFFFSVGNFWQKNDIFINLILIYCKIKEEDQGEEGKASEEVTLNFGLMSMLGMWEILGHSSPVPLSQRFFRI